MKVLASSGLFSAAKTGAESTVEMASATAARRWGRRRWRREIFMNCLGSVLLFRIPVADLGILDQSIAALPVQAAHGGIIIERGAFDVVERLDIGLALRQAGDQEASPAGPAHMIVVQIIAQRIECRFDPEADRVARVRGAEQRQHQVELFVDAPDGE